MKKTCLHRFLGECKECKEDYEPISANHPLNNYLCKHYYEINTITTDSVEFNLMDKMYLGFESNGELKEELLKKKAEELGERVKI
jgi:hypothetical protein